jgi:hypothetical protein
MTPGPGGNRSVVIHAHFYQPPREEPGLELVEREPGAAPDHDWNARIERECYRAVVAARIPAEDGRIARVVNTLELISFNVGPTLAEWLEVAAPDTWRAILSADRASSVRLGGHGNALAMPYHHLILPLASRRDKETEVRWGIADFRRRYGREPEGMWLPETAVDDETLDVVAAEGIRFTILAPHQVDAPPPEGRPGRYTTALGRTIAVFLYHGPLSHSVAFGPLITDSAGWAAELMRRTPSDGGPGLTSIATDGETYGHHHRFGEMALAATLERLDAEPEVRVENYSSFLARHPATDPVRLVSPSSWSCSHGVERWRSDCGCRARPDTSQSWRAPLRQAIDELATGLHRIFETESGPLLTDPWRARDAYATVGLPSYLPVRARELLEMERNVLRMFTSCGWFFDDIGGIESLVCLRYAARAIDLAGAEALDLEENFRNRLAAALSNDPAIGTGRDRYDELARPSHPGDVRAAAGYAVLLAVAPSRVRSIIGVYLVGPAGSGKVVVQHRRTGAEQTFLPAVRRIGRRDVAVDVCRECSGETFTVRFDELPEPEADQVRDAFRRDLADGLLSGQERDQVAEGQLRWGDAAAACLLRLLPAEAASSDPVQVERIEQALDLLLLDQLPVPFDAQTRFYRSLTGGPLSVRQALAPLAERLGFAPGAGAPHPA